MPDILCTPEFTNQEMLAIAALSALLEKTPEVVVRLAVSRFSSACVPTQDSKTAAA